MSSIQILVVEDDFLVAQVIQENIELLGFEVSGWVDNGKDAIQEVVNNKPDLAIMDFLIKGEIDGIETASQLARDYDIPIIYLTDQSDKETYDRAKSTSPHAFLAKPITPLTLQRSIELAITQVYKDQKLKQREADDLETGKVLNKHYMLKDREGLHAISLQEILYLEADKQYCHLTAGNKIWHISRAMGNVLESLHRAAYGKDHIIRISKSTCVNLDKIDKIQGNQVTIGGKEFSFGEKYRELLFQHIQTI
ncbi:MAG: response regulator [Flavobacteriales bacterium]|nr:response regulator [Flavobacteriales bacterium]